MKSKILPNIKIALAFLFFTNLVFGQAPNLGTAADFVLFSSAGAVSNSGTSLVTGNVGTNGGSSTGFGNVNGQMHDNDIASAKCATDLLIAYNQLKGTIATIFPAPLLGNGDTLSAGVYSIPSAATLDSFLILNAKGKSNAVFVFKILGSLSTTAFSKVKLINGALACNVFWQVEGLVSMASGTTMKGTIIANNAAITMNTGVTLEGRALSIAGAVSVLNVLAYMPIGCGSPILMGPSSPDMASTECYGLFAGSGQLTNTGTTLVMGDVGTNVGLTTGFNALNVTGNIHPIPDLSTANAAADLLNVYTNLNTLPYDIELLYPAQFGNNLVLTPHTYIMKGAAMLTDTLYLNAEGLANAVFVIQINGALATSTYSKVLLMNKAQAKNVFWKVDGAVSISDFSVFCGTIVCNNGAVDLKKGVTLNGRAYTTTGTFTTDAITTTMHPVCTVAGLSSSEIENANKAITIYPNPFGASAILTINDASQIAEWELKMYDAFGTEVKSVVGTSEKATTIDTSSLPSGVYFNKVSGNSITIQSGKLISRQ